MPYEPYPDEWIDEFAKLAASNSGARKAELDRKAKKLAGAMRKIRDDAVEAYTAVPYDPAKAGEIRLALRLRADDLAGNNYSSGYFVPLRTIQHRIKSGRLGA